jgi:hypothetical protein
MSRHHIYTVWVSALSALGSAFGMRKTPWQSDLRRCGKHNLSQKSPHGESMSQDYQRMPWSESFQVGQCVWSEMEEKIYSSCLSPVTLPILVEWIHTSFAYCCLIFCLLLLGLSNSKFSMSTFPAMHMSSTLCPLAGGLIVQRGLSCDLPKYNWAFLHLYLW